MLDLNIMFEIPCRRLKNYLILDRSKGVRGNIEVIMTPISQEEEDSLDNIDKGIVKIKRGNRTFIVHANRIYCYGDVDFNNKEDLEQIDNFNFVTRTFQGFIIPSNYDYNKHVAYTDNKNFYKYTETWRPSTIAKYCHGCLGKPEKILLFYDIN